LKEGSSIITTSSINAFKGNASLIPYTSTKGAEVRLAGAAFGCTAKTAQPVDAS
jgi:hypothetical protein